MNTASQWSKWALTVQANAAIDAGDTAQAAQLLDQAAALAIRYQLSPWDALIVASALLAGCDSLYSEDFQHGQVFDERLTVLNPFVTEPARR